MRNLWRGIALTAIASFSARDKHGTGTRMGGGGITNALTFVTAGSVYVLEAGKLTTVGVGQTPQWSPDGSASDLSIMILGNTSTIYLANTHGTGSKVLAQHTYPWVNPGWSKDGKYVLYTVSVTKPPVTLPNAAPVEHPIQLKVMAVKVADKSTSTLGTFTFTAGCSPKITALANGLGLAEGTYDGTPNTLLWAQPNLVAVQSSCTGIGLTVMQLKTKKTTTLPTWFGGVLSSDGSTIAASVAGPTPTSLAQVGLLTSTATEKTQVLGPKLGADCLPGPPMGRISMWRPGGRRQRPRA